MKRHLFASFGVLVLAGLLAVILPLEAQSPTPNNGGSFIPNTVSRMAGVWLNNRLLWDFQPPTRIASGFGTSPSLSSGNGNATFRITVGTGAAGGSTDSTGEVTMPAAYAGWNCVVNDMSAPAGFAMMTKQTASTTTSITLKGYLDNGVEAAWKAGTTLIVKCAAY